MRDMIVHIGLFHHPFSSTHKSHRNRNFLHPIVCSVRPTPPHPTPRQHDTFITPHGALRHGFIVNALGWWVEQASQQTEVDQHTAVCRIVVNIIDLDQPIS